MELEGILSTMLMSEEFWHELCDLDTISIVCPVHKLLSSRECLN